MNLLSIISEDDSLDLDCDYSHDFKTEPDDYLSDEKCYSNHDRSSISLSSTGLQPTYSDTQWYPSSNFDTALSHANVYSAL